MPKEFIMRGQTPITAPTEILNMTGYRPGYGYTLTEFQLYPSTDIPNQNAEMSATITAANTEESPTNPDFRNEGLIASCFMKNNNNQTQLTTLTIINDLFVITQDLILMVNDSSNAPVNWQIKFKEVKLSGPAEAVANYKQYTIYNTSS